jgi:hypothetical protein
VYFSFQKLEARLFLYANGTYKISYIFKKKYPLKLSDVIDTFDEIGSFLKDMNEKGVYNLTKDTNIFDSPFIEILEFDTYTDVEMTDSRLNIEVSLFQPNLKKVSSIFELIDFKNNIYALKFKEVNNFVDIDYNIHKVIMGTDKDKAIEELMKMKGLTFDAAKQRVEEEVFKIKQNININVKGDTISARKDFDTGVFMKLKVINNNIVRVTTTNTQNHEYVTNAIHYILLLLCQELDFVNTSSHRKSTAKKKFLPTSGSDTTLLDLQQIQDIINDVDLDDEDNDALLDSESDINDEDYDYDYDEDDDNSDEEYDNSDVDNDDSDLNNDEIIADQTNQSNQFITQQVLKKLERADPNLFITNPNPGRWNNNKSNQSDKKYTLYARQCGASDRRQPIVITESEKNHIDKNHPGSYTGFIQTSSKQQEAIRNGMKKDIPPEKRNFYICPRLWCHQSRVSLTEDEYAGMNNKCPKGEEAIRFTHEYFVKNGVEQHYPRFLKATGHPKGYRMPCCGNLKPDTLDEHGEVKLENEKSQSNLYVRTTDASTNNKENATLPTPLSNILYPEKTCKSGVINLNTSCFVRTGVSSEQPNTLLQIIQVLYSFKTITDLKNYISSKFTKTHFVFLNNGHTLRTHVQNDEAKQILQPAVFSNFKKDFLENNQYIKRFQLENISKRLVELTDMSKSYFEDTLERKTIIREFLIEKSYRRYMEYINNDAFEKNIDDFYHMLTFDLFKTNKNKSTNVVFLYASEQETWLYNSKYFDIWEYFDFNASTHIILQIYNSFEYVQFVNRKVFVSSIPSEKLKTFMNQMEKIKETMSNTTLDLADDKKYLYSSDNSKKDIVVLGMNFRAIGMIKNKKYESFKNEIRVNFNKLPHIKFMFAEAMNGQDNQASYLRRIDLDTFISTQDTSTQEFDTESKFKSDLYRLGDLMKKNKIVMENYNILHHELTHLSTDEKIKLIEHFLSKPKINIRRQFQHIDSIKFKDMLKMIILIHIDDLQEEYKSNTVSINETEELVTHAEVKNNKLLKMNLATSEYVKPIERGFDDFTTHEHINMSLIK